MYLAIAILILRLFVFDFSILFWGGAIIALLYVLQNKLKNEKNEKFEDRDH